MMIQIQVSPVENVTLVEVSGRVDSMNASELGEALMREIDGGSVQLVLDLSAVTYMSSAGLRELMAAYRKVRPMEGDVRIAQPSERVLDVLELSGLDTIFQIYPTRTDAVSSF